VISKDDEALIWGHDIFFPSHYLKWLL